MRHKQRNGNDGELRVSCFLSVLLLLVFKVICFKNSFISKCYCFMNNLHVVYLYLFLLNGYSLDYCIYSFLIDETELDFYIHMNKSVKSMNKPQNLMQDSCPSSMAIPRKNQVRSQMMNGVPSSRK